MKKVMRVILDTSIFVNPASRRFFGKTPGEALSNFLDEIRLEKSISFYMPPSIYEELMKFIEQDIPIEKTILIDKRPPSSYQSSVPAILVYDFIEEMRSRINKGLRITEKYARRGLKNPPSEDRKKEEEIIKTLRQEYRTALREGVIDSKEDFDLILLAKELDAYLATSDKGLVKWAAKLGISCIDAPELKEFIKP
ncbi:MAG: RNA ligase partner protein [Candidatus Omnitrophota bacterium]